MKASNIVELISWSGLIEGDTESQTSDVDAILILGDYVMPRFNTNKDLSLSYRWALMRELIGNITKTIEKKFPGVPILPVIGNNDNIFNYVAPNQVNLKIEVHDFLFETWF